MKRLSRVLFVTFAAITVAALLAADSPKEEPSREGLLNRVAELEKRIAELEARLKKVESGEDAKPIELDYIPTDADKRIAKALDAKLPINFELNKLVNVIDYFRNTTGVSFFVDWAKLEAVGVDQDTVITMQLNETTASTSLKLVLRQAIGGAKSADDATFAIYDGVVIVSSKKGIAQLVGDKVRFKSK